MIAKRVSMKSVRKSNFAEVAKYIIDEHDKHERVGTVTVTNCHSDRPDAAVAEILNTQAKNQRAAEDKTYHLIVSFRPGEQPDEATLKTIEARICDALGYGEHQRVSAVHHDTDNLHIHIAINKIHPTRYTILHPYNDYKTLSAICEKLEREFGLERDNHQPQKSRAENRADDMEHQAGIESLIGWIKRECYDEIAGAQSWTELHQLMRSNGLDLHERGNGLVITAADGTTVKASSVGPDCSKSRLQARFGAFEPSPERLADELLAKKYQQEPMRMKRNTAVNTVELNAKYRKEQQDAGAARAEEWAKARARKNRLIEAAKRSGRLKRAAIKLVQGAGPGKKLMYAMTSSTLVAEIGKINKQYLKDRREIYDKYRRLAWADWLRVRATEGNQEALAALRAREATQGFNGNTVSGKGRQKPMLIHPEQDSVTKKGTIIYRVGPTAVRDDGDKLTITRGANHDGLQAALRMAMARYGDCISIQGSAAFKEQVLHAAAEAKLPITLDDAVLEQRRKDLMHQAPQKTPQAPTTKESEHEQSVQFRHVSPRRPAGRSIVRSGSASARTTAAGPKGRAGGVPAAHIAGRVAKPHVGRVGQSPPPESQHRLRSLSELGVVRIAGGGEVLLPGHVPYRMEQQRAAADHGLRWSVTGPARAGQLSAGLAAAEKYIVEREQKRLTISDIPKHVRYHEHDGLAAFAGIRQVEGQILALLKNGDEVMVLPIDAASARRLKRFAIGDAVTVSTRGSIKTRGRSR